MAASGTRIRLFLIALHIDQCWAKTEFRKEEHAVQEGSAAWETYPVQYLDFNTGQYDKARGLISRLRA